MLYAGRKSNPSFDWMLRVIKSAESNGDSLDCSAYLLVIRILFFRGSFPQIEQLYCELLKGETKPNGAIRKWYMLAMDKMGKNLESGLLFQQVEESKGGIFGVLKAMPFKEAVLLVENKLKTGTVDEALERFKVLNPNEEKGAVYIYNKLISELCRQNRLPEASSLIQIMRSQLIPGEQLKLVRKRPLPFSLVLFPHFSDYFPPFSLL